LADDCVSLLTALERLLKADCEIVGRATTVAELLEQTRFRRPEVIVLDVMLSGSSGLDACRQLKETIPGVTIVILTAMEDADVRSAALNAGATDVISKLAPHARLLAAIHNIGSRKSAAQLRRLDSR
jgi:DNA-binding NarL/FixJ family response regulator